MARTIVLLGPQRLHPILVTAFDELGLEGPIATVTAGWQEREAEVEEMREHLGRPVVNLRLYARAEQLFGDDPKLAQLYHQRQERLRDLQELYRLRLADALRTARELARKQGVEPSLIEPERQAAIDAVRQLDAHHLERIRGIHEDFDAAARPFDRPALLRLRTAMAKELAGTTALAIAGGHVAVLLNRLRLFGVLDLAPRHPVFAWSAGAMALGPRVVLFHDNPPQGPGDAEVLERGLGLFDDVLALPHASKRLALEDPVLVALFARRFAPLTAVAFDPKTRLVRRAGGNWKPLPETRRLSEDGAVVAITER
ncbi:MAG TPA: hypothetical protein VF017_08920 [Thermoanaerobaculia bacterium]|nr:hypothetical protein [Thermoanaerobaculia bacterium]